MNKINKMWWDGDQLMANITITTLPPINFYSMSFTVKPQGWRDLLDSYYRTSFINGNYMVGDERLTTIQKEMQEKFPGKYVVEDFYNNEKMRFDLRLRFDDPKQETMWKIKNG